MTITELCDFLTTEIGLSRETLEFARKATIDPNSVNDFVDQLARQPLEATDQLLDSLPALTAFQSLEIKSASLRNRQPCLIKPGSRVIRDALGEGGFASVFRVWNLIVRRTEAVKVLHPNLASVSEHRERFERECRSLQGIKHPNLPEYYEMLVNGSEMVLAMEYIPGANLNDVIARNQPGGVSFTQAVEWLRAALSALICLHGAGIRHRDIKPKNLVVTAAGNLKIVDFGLARNESDRTITVPGTVHLTPMYAAPEQFDDFHGVDPRADIYSLGCTIFYAVTGKPPFTGISAAQYRRSHQEVARPHVASLCNDDRAKLDAILFQMMAIEPADRHQSAVEVLDMLNAITGTPTIIMPTVQHSSSSSPQVASADRGKPGEWVPPPSINVLSSSGRPKRIIDDRRGRLAEMVFVEGGIFECWDESGIKSQLYELSDFYIDTRLVSYRQFSRFAKGQSGLNDDWERHRLASASDDWPVRGVTWEDAQKFAESLAQGRPGRERWSLPLDIQWQLVATNRSVCLQPWSLHVQRANSSDYLRTGSPDYLPCLPNPLGVYDLGNGNLREWVYDWFASRPEDRWFLKRGPLSALSSSKPRTRNYSGPITGKQRSVRGGHFSDPGGPADWFRSSAHPARTPAEFNGFRAVWILE